MLDWMVELLDLPERFRSTSADRRRRDPGLGERGHAGAPSWPPAGGRPAGAVNHDGDTTRLVAYATAQAHSSVEKGLRIAGIGTDRLRVVAHDERFAMRPDALAAVIAADRAAGLVPFFVCATRGTTSSMAFDPTPAHRRRSAATHGVWLHVDAAMSGIAALAPELRWVNDGLELRRQLLHQPAQVDGRQLRLRPVLDRRPGRPARRAEHPARVPALGGRRGRARRSTTATGRCRSAAASGPSSCG